MREGVLLEKRESDQEKRRMGKHQGEKEGVKSRNFNSNNTALKRGRKW